jgi:hypothetical protein
VEGSWRCRQGEHSFYIVCSLKVPLRPVPKAAGVSFLSANGFVLISTLVPFSRRFACSPRVLPRRIESSGLLARWAVPLRPLPKTLLDAAGFVCVFASVLSPVPYFASSPKVLRGQTRSSELHARWTVLLGSSQGPRASASSPCLVPCTLLPLFSHVPALPAVQKCRAGRPGSSGLLARSAMPLRQPPPGCKSWSSFLSS